MCLNQRAEVWQASFLMKASLQPHLHMLNFLQKQVKMPAVRVSDSNGQESDLNQKLLVHRFMVFIKVCCTLQDRNLLSCNVFNG